MGKLELIPSKSAYRKDRIFKRADYTNGVIWHERTVSLKGEGRACRRFDLPAEIDCNIGKMDVYYKDGVFLLVASTAGDIEKSLAEIKRVRKLRGDR